MNELQFLSKLGRMFPKSTSDVWDHPGYQCGTKHLKKEVKKVFLCLDFTEDCFEKAWEEKPDLILTHHPFFFGKRKVILERDPLKAELTKRIESELDCPIYSYHTDFDRGLNGMNDTMIEVFGFTKENVLQDGLMRTLSFPKAMTMEEIVFQIKEKCNLPRLQYIKSTDEPLSKACLIMGGAGGYFMEAKDAGVSLYISGDCPHHSRLDMKRYWMNYIELPHECEEIGFLKGMEKAVHHIDENIEVIPFAFESYFEEL